MLSSISAYSKTKLMDFLRQLLAAGLILLASAPQQLHAGEVNKDNCRLHTDSDYIDAAIQITIDLGERFRRHGKNGASCSDFKMPPCPDTIPYRSINEFKSANPNCCTVRTTIPGDYSPQYIEAARSMGFPETIKQVVLVYRVNIRDPHNRDRSIESMSNHQILVDCMGNLVRLRPDM